MAISPELEAIYNGSNLSATQIDTVEISHPNLSTNFYFCNHHTNLLLGTEKETVVFKATAFSYKIPPQKKEGLGQFIFSFPLLDFKVIEELNSFINSTAIPIEMIYRVYTSNFLSAPSSTLTYKIKAYEVSISENIISLTGSIFSNVSKKIPTMKYTVESFPGLKYI